jgi:Fe(3+) dicitrate transport protein
LIKLLLYILIITTSILGFSQSAEIKGKIKSSNGESIPGAFVVLDDIKKTSESDGSYIFKNVENGNHVFKISAIGFNSIEKTITIIDNKNLNLDFDLTEFGVQLDSSIEVIATNMEEGFGIGYAPPIKGTVIYDGKKHEILKLDHLSGNKSSGNARELYAKVPGLNIWESDSYGIQLGIGGRGLSPNRTANFNTRQNGYDISADALGYPESYYSPPTEALDAIEIIRGAASLQYGSQFGGLLNFRMRKPSHKNLEFTTRNTGGMYGYFGTFTQLNGTVKNFSYNTYYQYKRADGYRANSNFDQHQYFINLNYHFTENIRLGVEYTYMNYLAKQAGGLTDAQFDEDPRQSFRDRNWFKVNWNLIALNFDWEFSNATKLNIKAFSNLSSRSALGWLGRADRPDLGTERDLIEGRFRNIGVEARVLHKYKLGKNYGAFLFGARVYVGHTNNKQGLANDGDGPDFEFINDDNNLSGSDYLFPSQNYAAFAENIFFITKEISITPGIRFEYITTASEGYWKQYTVHPLTGEILNTTTNYDTIRKSRPVFLAGLGFSYKPSAKNLRGKLNLYANISQNYRAINFSDIRIINENIQVDPNIKDEKGFNADIGLRGVINKCFYYDFSFFYLQYNDKIGEKVVDNQLYKVRTNISDARNIGIEFFAEFDFIKCFKPKGETGFSIFANFSYIDAKYQSSEVSAFNGNRIENVPEYTIRTGIKFKHKGFTTSVQFNHIAEQYTDATNSTFTPTAVYGLIPSYYVMDFSASYRFKKWFAIEAGVNNFTNNQYFTRRSVSYPGPGIIPSDGIYTYLTLEFKIATAK